MSEERDKAIRAFREYLGALRAASAALRRAEDIAMNAYGGPYAKPEKVWGRLMKESFSSEVDAAIWRVEAALALATDDFEHIEAAA